MKNFLICICLLILRLVAAYPIEAENESNCTDIGSGCKPTNDFTEQDYMLIVSNDLFAIKVLLKMTKCVEYDPQNPLDIESYTIEAITENEQPIGKFTNINPYLDAAELSTGNMIIFQSNFPSVMDFPAKYEWKPYVTDVHQTICFRTTIIKSFSNETLTQCILPDESMFTESVITFETPTTPTTEPSPEKIASCSEKWNCDNARQNDICGDNGVTYPSRCAMRYDACILDITIEGTKGACEEPTAPPTPVTTPTPKPELPRGNCGNSPACSNLGYYKRIQCIKYGSRVTCWCSKLEQDTRIGPTVDGSCEENSSPIEVATTGGLTCYST